MQHMGTKRIKTSRLTLRKFTMNDRQEVYNNWANDPSVTEFLRWPAHSNTDITEKVLESWISGYKENNFYQWAIVLDETGEPIGCISVVDQNDTVSMVHIGYCIGKKWWHKGYTSEALSALIDFFFIQVGVNRIESQHDPDNPNSGKVMKKCGMKYEGTMRQADFSNKGIVDACIYAILRDEWKKFYVNESR